MQMIPKKNQNIDEIKKKYFIKIAYFISKFSCVIQIHSVAYIRVRGMIVEWRHLLIKFWICYTFCLCAPVALYHMHIHAHRTPHIVVNEEQQTVFFPTSIFTPINIEAAEQNRKRKQLQVVPQAGRT